MEIGRNHAAVDRIGKGCGSVGFGFVQGCVVHGAPFVWMPGDNRIMLKI